MAEKKSARVLVAAPLAPSVYYKKGLHNGQIVEIAHTFTDDDGDTVAVVYDPTRPEIVYQILLEFLELLDDAQELAQRGRTLWQRAKNFFSNLFNKK